MSARCVIFDAAVCILIILRLRFDGHHGIPWSTSQDFIQILSTPDAEEIIPAVFCPCQLRYWKGERRLIWRTAYVLHGEMNVAVGPSKEHFEKKFLGEMGRAAATEARISDAHEDHKDKDEIFFEILLPHRFEKIPGHSQIPVDIFQGVLSGLHRNPEVQRFRRLNMLRVTACFPGVTVDAVDM